MKNNTKVSAPSVKKACAVKSRTQIKIFRGFGSVGIDDIESAVNRWLLQTKVRVMNIETSLCSVGNPREEIFQCITITVWYGDAP